MVDQLTIRPPKGRDFPHIGKALEAAYGRETEAQLAEGVRAQGLALLELVVDDDGEICGYVLVSRLEAEPQRRMVALGPVAVTPGRQTGGLGSALCKAALDYARQLGAEAVVALGPEAWLTRFGFSHAAAANLTSPYQARPDFLALELTPGALGVATKVTHPSAFM